MGWRSQALTLYRPQGPSRPTGRPGRPSVGQRSPGYLDRGPSGPDIINSFPASLHGPVLFPQICGKGL